MKYNGKVDDQGKLTIFHKEKFLQEVRSLTGKNVEITLQRKRKKRGNKQLAYYYGAVLPMIQEKLNDDGIRIEKSQIDYMLRNRFLYHEIPPNKFSGEILKYPKRLQEDLTDVTTTDMMAYFEDVKQWAFETLDIYIPDPNEEITLPI